MRSHPLVDLASPEFRDNPYPFYSRLRDQAPVCRVRLPDRRQAWLVTRYDDVLGVLKDARFVKNRINAQTADQRRKQPWMPAFARPLLQNMLDLDPPDHTRLRMLVQKAFTPRIVEDMRERIAGLTQELLTPLRRAGRRFK